MQLTDKQIQTLRANNELSRKYTKEAINTALLQLSENKKYSEIKVSEIIERSGVARSAFYRNYKTKDDVLLEIVQELIDEIIKNVEKSIEHNWKCIFDVVTENSYKMNLLVNSGLSYMILDKMNESILTEDPCNKMVILNGMIYNVLLFYIKAGYPDAQKTSSRIMTTLSDISLTGK